MAALNEFGAIRAEVKADVLELAGLDKVLADMKNKELNAQLKVVLDEKQDILERIAAQEQDEEQGDAETIRVKIRDAGIEIERKLC